MSTVGHTMLLGGTGRLRFEDEPCWDKEVNLPVQGKTARIRHAGSTGAQIAARRRGVQTVRYLALLAERGPLSDHEAFELLKDHVHGLSSIVSIRNGCGELVEDSGQYQETDFRTKRTRWRRTR